MKKVLTSLWILIGVSAYSQCNQLVWFDEFNGNSVDRSKWNFQNGDGCPNLCGWGNGERESYTNDPKNVKVANGLLTITAIRENVGNSEFTSSKMLTNGLHSWKFGRFEARMRLTRGRGLWPAFWMLSTNNQWPTTGEIDIMENRGDRPRQLDGTLHYGQQWPNNRYDGTAYIHSQNLSDNFHTYAVEWSEDEIKWYFDNTLYKTETKNPNSLNPASNSSNVWPWNTNFYLILNLAVGGSYTGNPTVEQIELIKPTFEIDYVRVFSGVGNTSRLLPPVITGVPKMFLDENKVFSVQAVSGATYNWNVTGGNSSIVSGQNTNSITIKNTSESLCSLSVTVSIPANNNCPAESLSSSKTISTHKNNCTFMFNDFEVNSSNAANLTEYYGSASIEDNPAISGTNSSAKALRYVRTTNQFDLIILDEALLKNGSDYENGSFAFEMDLLSSKPAGTPIEIQIASASAWNGGWPTGRHTVYRAITSKTNQWETLRFNLSETADPNRAQFNSSVDRLVVLLNPNSTSSDTYFLDNLKRVSINNTNCLVTGTEDNFIKGLEQLSVFPLPAKDFIHINGIKENSSISIFNIHGAVILETRNKSIDLSSLSSGIYFIHSENQRVKFIKE